MNFSEPPKIRSQGGIALMTVMLVLSVVTVVLVAMSSDRQMDIRRTENQLRTIQAWEYVYGLEAWAIKQLKIDVTNNLYDDLTDKWNKPLTSKPIPEGNIQAEIVDLQGRINLNNLLIDGEASEEDILRLKRLLINLKINTDLVDVMLDWIDADMDLRTPNSAEDETYSKFTPPYRSANVPFSDVSELLRLKGMTLKDYKKLLPYIYVANERTPININTASAVVLRTFAPDITKNQAESLYNASGKPFKEIEEFLKDEAMEGIVINKESISVASHHFLLSGQIDMGKNVLIFDSQLNRNDLGEVKVVKRLRKGVNE
jgi:general secretion pathway protein K